MSKKLFVYSLILSFLFFLGCGADPKGELLKEASAVWRDGNGILWSFDLTTPKTMFEMAVGDQKQSASIFIENVDTEKLIVVLKMVRPDNKEKILTLQKVFNDDQKKEYHFIYTLDNGAQETLTYVRSIAPGAITGK